MNVHLTVYDLSRGLAKTLSPMLLGKQIDAIYHTAIIVNGFEYFYGGTGISRQEARLTDQMLGEPLQVKLLAHEFKEKHRNFYLNFLSL